MLPKNRRIVRKEFSDILKTGRRYNSPHLLAYIAMQKNGGPSKFSFSLSKKVSPKATDRNYYRRRGYSVISEMIKKTKPGFLCFFTYKKGSIPVSYSVLETEISELLYNSGVLI